MLQAAEKGADPSIGITGGPIGAGAATAIAAGAPALDALDARGAGAAGTGLRGTARRGARRLGWLAALGAALLLAACSSIRLGYNNADTLLLYSLDRYFDLDDGQQALARDRLRELLAWHRSTQLAGYADLLASAERKLDGEVMPEDVLALQRMMNARLAAIGEQAAPDLARLALTLQPAQIEHFAAKMAESNAKERRWIVSLGGTPTQEERVKRFVERAQDWLGPLTDAQVDLLRQAVAQRPRGAEGWVAERARRQQDLLAVLTRIQREQPPADTAADWLRAYFADLAEPQSPERRARAVEFRNANAALIAQLVNSATPQQRAHAAKRLRGYASDVTALAGNGGRG